VLETDLIARATLRAGLIHRSRGRRRTTAERTLRDLRTSATRKRTSRRSTGLRRAERGTDSAGTENVGATDGLRLCIAQRREATKRFTELSNVTLVPGRHD
jgi:hypothetical protein